MKNFIRYILFVFVSTIAVFTVFIGFSLFLLWALKSFQNLQQKLGIVGFITTMLFIGFIIWALLWELFKGLCTKIVSYTMRLAPAFGWSYKFIIGLSLIMGLWTIGALWLSPDVYNFTSILICLFGTWLCYSFTFHIVVTAAGLSKEYWS